jgi:hypothetical protein
MESPMVVECTCGYVETVPVPDALGAAASHKRQSGRHEVFIYPTGRPDLRAKAPCPPDTVDPRGSKGK